MRIAIKAGEEQKAAMLNKGVRPGITIYWLAKDEKLATIEVDAYFDLLFNSEFIADNEFIAEKPAFVNAVSCTTTDLGHSNYIRLNAWPGFWERSIVEVASGDMIKPAAEYILQQLGWQYTWAPDEPGMISARIISLIINEAYYGLGDGISSAGEIDVAMKLGTNYPYGPFEWAQKIGVNNIYYLLKKLQQQFGERYTPAPLLTKQSINNGTIA